MPTTRLINKETKEELTLVLPPTPSGRVLVQKHTNGLLEVVDQQLLEVVTIPHT